MFVKENLNPKGRKTTDCVIRAISKASEKPYVEVMEMLFEQQKKTFYHLDEKTNYELVILALGFEKIPIKVSKGDTRPTVEQISQITKGNKKKVIAAVAHHLVACEEGNYYDTWDCGHKSLYSYYIKR